MIHWYILEYLFIPIRINKPHWIVSTICIRTDAVVFLAEGDETVPAGEKGIVLTGTVVKGVQAVRAVELLVVGDILL